MGDIARIDMTLGATTGRILVTFFDVRSAEKVLHEFRGSAELFPPAAHDFRAVSIATSTFAELPTSFAGFHAFGEIAGVSVSGEDMVVEFYDMRAAQQVTLTIPGSRPRRPLPLPARQDYPPAQPGAGPPMPPPTILDGFKESSMPGLDPTICREAREPGLLASPSLLQDAGLAAAMKPTVASPTAAGKPNREKVSSKDLSKFDILPEKIRSGEDLRTTVMVRNIPKACTRENFVEMLSRGGLDDRYSFFYMPFDKRRNIHCGFAFVNFRSPMDVLKLHECMQTLLFRNLCHGQQPPALSYARLQGQDQLMKHFSLSAVMYDNDARKRPVFFRGTELEQDPCAAHFFTNFNEGKVSLEPPGMQPRYVSLSGPLSPAGKKDFGLLQHGCDLVREATFLMSNAAGA